MKTSAFSPDMNGAEHWRMRAEEMRRMTEEIHDPPVRSMMLRLAARFDRLAENAEVGLSQASVPETAPATFGGNTVDP